MSFLKTESAATAIYMQGRLIRGLLLSYMTLLLFLQTHKDGDEYVKQLRLVCSLFILLFWAFKQRVAAGRCQYLLPVLIPINPCVLWLFPLDCILICYKPHHSSLGGALRPRHAIHLNNLISIVKILRMIFQSKLFFLLFVFFSQLMWRLFAQCCCRALS